jgi:hypothetical protein
MNINFAEVESGFEAIPEGTYSVVIEKVEVRESKSSDNDYLNWEFSISEGEFEDRRLWMITSLSEKALFKLKDVFEALEVLEDDMDLDWDEDVEITPQAGPLLLYPEVSGLACQVVVKNEVYQGTERNRIDTVLAQDKGSGAAKKSSGAKKGPSGGRKSRAKSLR